MFISHQGQPSEVSGSDMAEKVQALKEEKTWMVMILLNNLRVSARLWRW